MQSSKTRVNVPGRETRSTAKISPDPDASSSANLHVSTKNEVKIRGSKRHRNGTVASTSRGSRQDGVDDPEVQHMVEQMEVTREILGSDYVNVVKRLKLDWAPYCVDHKEYCKTHHNRKCPRPKVVDSLQSRSDFWKYNRELHSLKSMQDMCTQMEFPGGENLQQVLEAILISKEEYLVHYCIDVAETILIKFPPCWPDINRTYREVLLVDIDITKYCNRDGGTERKFFIFVMDLLLETISISDGTENANEDQVNADFESENESRCYGFQHCWEDEEEKFTMHTRQEKLDRLFSVLNIFTKILEYDFSIWLLRYPSKVRQKLLSDTGPLFSQIFFDGTSNLLTSKVKSFLEIFVICINLRFPSDKIDIMSRIMSLLSVAVAAYETQPKLPEVTYPLIAHKTNQLVKEIFKTTLDNFGCRIDLLLGVIKAIRVPFVKYLFIDQLFRKLDSAYDEMNVKKIYELFRKRRWDCMEGTRQENPSAEKKYQNMSPKKQQQRPKACDMYKHEYLEIVLDSLRAYCETFQIREVICKAFVETPRKVVTPSAENQPGTPSTPMAKYHLHKVEVDIEDIEKKLKIKQTFTRCSKKEVPYTNIYIGIDTMFRYRDDVKYLGILQDHIKPLYKGDKQVFKEWHDFLESILSVK